MSSIKISFADRFGAELLEIYCLSLSYTNTQAYKHIFPAVLQPPGVSDSPAGVCSRQCWRTVHLWRWREAFSVGSLLTGDTSPRRQYS